MLPKLYPVTLRDVQVGKFTFPLTIGKEFNWIDLDPCIGYLLYKSVENINRIIDHRLVPLRTQALAIRLDMILADESTGELETTTTHQILSLFQYLVEKEGIILLLTTHAKIINGLTDIIYTKADGHLALPNVAA